MAVATPPHASDASLASVIDTIEAIIIALIIALTFRAFIVEAFVIPTGSMAPTLLGAHFMVKCPVCGYEFDYNADLADQLQLSPHNGLVLPSDPDQHAELVSNIHVPVSGLPIYCPNCRFPISATQLPQYLITAPYPDMHQGGVPRSVPFAWANNGDRILVLKYLYAVDSPHRFDVIVFKEPKEARDNYIKRLIGLPGETVEIINGDIYITPPNVNPADPTKRLIARKPDYVQQNLWQLVYDNDFYPTDAGHARPQADTNGNILGPDAGVPWTNPWIPQTDNWTSGVVMNYTGAGASGLDFNIRPAYAEHSPYTLNVLGYNNDIYQSNDDFTPRSVVGDLRMQAVWTPQQGAASSIQLTLGRPNNCYRVSWSGGKISRRVLRSGNTEFQTRRRRDRCRSPGDCPRRFLQTGAQQCGPGHAVLRQFEEGAFLRATLECRTGCGRFPELSAGRSFI